MRKIILMLVAPVFFFPHLLVFLMSSNKAVIIADLYARKQTQENKLKQLVDLSQELLENRYFRTLFYFRTPSFLTNVLRIFYPKHSSFIIDVATKIGKGLRLAHPYSTILNAQSIGENVYINHLVTLGEIRGKRPIIGNNVQIHANATIIGGIYVGENAIIGAGAVVVKDVPANAVAVGNPAKIIQK